MVKSKIKQVVLVSDIEAAKEKIKEHRTFVTKRINNSGASGEKIAFYEGQADGLLAAFKEINSLLGIFTFKGTL